MKRNGLAELALMLCDDAAHSIILSACLLLGARTTECSFARWGALISAHDLHLRNVVEAIWLCRPRAECPSCSNGVIAMLSQRQLFAVRRLRVADNVHVESKRGALEARLGNYHHGKSE